MNPSLRQKILDRLSELQQSPKKSLGQNFLISEHVVQKIVEVALRDSPDKVVEIGPGLGSLTDEWLSKNVPLTLLELDDDFVAYWQARGVSSVIHGDALDCDWSQIFSSGNSVLVSNLPYQISSRLVIDLSVSEYCPNKMVLMFQKEVAKRITAKHNEADYSLLTFIAQTFWQTSTLLEAGAVDFHPKPNVASRVVVFKRRQIFAKDVQKEILRLAKVAFEQRKKILKKRLDKEFSAEKVSAAYAQLSIEEGARVAQLPPQKLLELFASLKPFSLDPSPKPQ